jgi:hypothetical protein
MEFIVGSSSPIKNYFRDLICCRRASAWRRHFVIGENGLDFREKRREVPRPFSRSPRLGCDFQSPAAKIIADSAG